jgi:hypothetical protein
MRRSHNAPLTAENVEMLMSNPSKICERHRAVEEHQAAAGVQHPDGAERHKAGKTGGATDHARMAHGHMSHTSDHSAQSSKQNAAQHSGMANAA